MKGIVNSSLCAANNQKGNGFSWIDAMGVGRSHSCYINHNYLREQFKEFLNALPIFFRNVTTLNNVVAAGDFTASSECFECC